MAFPFGFFFFFFLALYCLHQHLYYLEAVPLPSATIHIHTFLLYTCFVFTKLCEDNHMLVAPSVCKWLPTPDSTGHSDKRSNKQSYAPSLHASSKLEINMIPLLSTHRSLCYALLALSASIQIATVSQSFVLARGQTKLPHQGLLDQFKCQKFSQYSLKICLILVDTGGCCIRTWKIKYGLAIRMDQ